MDANNLNAVDVEARKAKEEEIKRETENALPKLPSNPLQAQLKYKDESTRYIKLYGSGEYDFGIIPNSDQGVLIDMLSKRSVDFLDRHNGRTLSPAEKYRLAAMGHVQALWKFYKAGAKIAGIRVEHVARQFEAEYQTDPRQGEDPDPVRAAAFERKEAEWYKGTKLQMLRLIAKTNPEYVSLDGNGNPVYIEAKHGQYALMVFRIDREGRECGRV